MDDLHLVQWLRRIQQVWELDMPALSRITHVSEIELKDFLEMSREKLEALPTVPLALLPCVPLVSLFKRIQEEYPDAKAQNEWLLRPNAVLEGQVPAEVIAISSEHLAYVSYVVESGLRLQKAKE